MTPHSIQGMYVVVAALLPDSKTYSAYVKKSSSPEGLEPEAFR